MQHQHGLILLMCLALFFALACQTAYLFGEPTPTQSIQTANTTPALLPPTPLPPTAEPPSPAPPTRAPAPPTFAPATLDFALPTAEPSSTPAAPAATRTLAPVCANPNIAITSLGVDSNVSGLLELRGTATDPNMQYWKVEYRPGSSTAYMLLNRSDQAVTDGVLARWSTKTAANGVYWIRLVVVFKDGNTSTPCEIRFNIAN